MNSTATVFVQAYTRMVTGLEQSLANWRVLDTAERREWTDSLRMIVVDRLKAIDRASGDAAQLARLRELLRPIDARLLNLGPRLWEMLRIRVETLLGTPIATLDSPTMAANATIALMESTDQHVLPPWQSTSALGEFTRIYLVVVDRSGISELRPKGEVHGALLRARAQIEKTDLRQDIIQPAVLAAAGRTIQVE